jgi:hypothetical protein
MKKIMLALLLMNLHSVIAQDDAKQALNQRVSIAAEKVSFSTSEEFNYKIQSSDIDYEFNIPGAKIQLRGFTQSRSKPLYHQELEDAALKKQF